jgi:hypothetical protein
MALRRGEAGAARIFCSHMLHWAAQSQQYVLAVFALGFVGWLAELRGELERAAALFGAYDQLVQQFDRSSLGGFDAAPVHAARDRARAQLGELAFGAAYASGQQLSFDDAAAAARELVGVPPLDEQGRPAPLTLPLSETP